MVICMCQANSYSYCIPGWQVIVSAVILTGIGLLGSRIMFRIEGGADWSGRSFYGAVFLTPILLWPVAKILRISYGALMDLAAPAECIMLAILKVKCQIDGCCRGRIFITQTGTFRFPSQIVECITAILIMIVLLILIKRQNQQGKIFSLYLIIYGITRFILNLFRETTPWIGPLAAGNFWSLVSIGIGFTSIFMISQRRNAGY